MRRTSKDKANPRFRLETILAGQQGSLLIGVVFTMTAIAVLGAAMVDLTSTSSYTELLANRREAAYYLAESGARYATPQIRQDTAQAITDLDGKTFALGSAGSFALAIDNTNPNFLLLEATGLVNAGTWLETRVASLYQFARGSMYDHAVYGGDEVKLEDHAYVDSYDSSQGAWVAEGAGANGDVGTNSADPADIDVDDHAVIYGDQNLDQGKDMTAADMPAGGDTSLGDELHLEDNDIMTLSGGPYRLEELKIEDHAVLYIDGDVTLYVEEEIEVKDHGVIEILAPPAGTLTIYVGEEIKFKEHAQVNASLTPAHLLIYGTGSGEEAELTIEGEAEVHAAIHAPQTEIKLKDHAAFFGALIGAEIELEDHAAVHYDEALSIGGGGGGGALGEPLQYFKPH